MQQKDPSNADETRPNRRGKTRPETEIEILCQLEQLIELGKASIH